MHIHLPSRMTWWQFYLVPSIFCMAIYTWCHLLQASRSSSVSLLPHDRHSRLGRGFFSSPADALVPASVSSNIASPPRLRALIPNPSQQRPGLVLLRRGRKNSVRLTLPFLILHTATDQFYSTIACAIGRVRVTATATARRHFSCALAFSLLWA